MKRMLSLFTAVAIALCFSSCKKDEPKHCWNVRAQDGSYKYRNLCNLTDAQVREQYPCDCSYEIGQ